MMGGGMMGGFGYGGYGGLGLIGLILNLVIAVGIIVAVVVLIVWLARRLGSGSGSSPYTDSAVLKPRDILQVRYARGEISRDQYKEMLSDLG